jgi:hypothetical protein
MVADWIPRTNPDASSVKPLSSFIATSVISLLLAQHLATQQH